MTSKLKYPKIMEPGQLKALNNYVFSRLGTPIFFTTPNPARPRAHGASGSLYEVVTGLYLIYRDYGMRLLKTYLDFCEETAVCKIEDSRLVFRHYYSVNAIRGGFCHGCLPGGVHVNKLLNKMNYYVWTPNVEKTWPDFMGAMTEVQCSAVVNKLSANSNRLVEYVKVCADEMALDEELVKRWRQRLVARALNPRVPQYGYDNNKRYFDERIVNDLETAVRKEIEPKPHQQTLQKWLSTVESQLLNGTACDSNVLYRTLVRALEELYHPINLQAECSSAALLLGDFML